LIHREEAQSIGKNNLVALSNWLGNKPYMMGASPTPLDCTAFGFLVVGLYNFPEDHFLRKVIQDLPNLVAYVRRMKEQYWPDWDQVIAKH
jgi:glutathione S-transferase